MLKKKKKKKGYTSYEISIKICDVSSPILLSISWANYGFVQVRGVFNNTVHFTARRNNKARRSKISPFTHRNTPFVTISLWYEVKPLQKLKHKKLFQEYTYFWSTVLIIICWRTLLSFAVNRKYLFFLLSIQHWHYGGHAVATTDMIRLTPNIQSRSGWLFNEFDMQSDNWEVKTTSSSRTKLPKTFKYCF